jgi:hypothetical protein
MPLRDHFRPPLASRTKWGGFHGAWPTLIVADLNRRLPARYVAEPRVQLGTSFEVDIGALEEDASGGSGTADGATTAEGEGGVARAVWAPPRPTFGVTTEPPGQDEYEVRVYDRELGRRLVAAVEIVSEANKDRPDNRQAFVAKYAALLRHGVSVAIVDLVTTRQFNLYGDLLRLVGQDDPALSAAVPPIYAVSGRWAHDGTVWRLETWAHALAVGQPLPTLPLWLADDLAVPLYLEATYEETCRVLRIP